MSHRSPPEAGSIFAGDNLEIGKRIAETGKMLARKVLKVLPGNYEQRRSRSPKRDGRAPRGINEGASGPSP